jgi:hypothetical protein
MKPLSKQDHEFLMDMIKLSADRYYKSDKKLTALECVLLSAKELGFSVTPSELLLITYHIKNGGRLNAIR